MTDGLPFDAPEVSPVCPSAVEPHRNAVVSKCRVIPIVLRISSDARSYLLSPFATWELSPASPLASYAERRRPHLPFADTVPPAVDERLRGSDQYREREY